MHIHACMLQEVLYFLLVCITIHVHCVHALNVSLHTFSLREGTVAFSHNIVDWLFAALQDLPAPLGIRKVQSKSSLISHAHNIAVL